MSKYDDLFDATAPTDSVFDTKGALDPLAPPDSVRGRDDQEQQLATILSGVNEGYLPTTVSVYGPPGTGKTVTTRRVCEAFAARHDAVAVEYVNCKECRTLFSAANEIHLELTGEKKGAYEGLDGVFEGIWTALTDYPAWTVLLLDEIDHVQHDANYDPSDFFYRLLRGEGKLKRDIDLSVWLLSNQVLDVDLRLDSRVESAMSGEAVFFPPYGRADLHTILAPRVERAFRDGAVSDAVVERGVTAAAQRWGDARKALRLFRQAGEVANEQGLDAVTPTCIEASLGGTEREATIEKLHALPERHLAVLAASVSWRASDGTIVQPVRVSRIHDRLTRADTPDRFQVGERALRDLVTDLETMGLVATWTESAGRGGRAKYVETAFAPEWVRAAQDVAAVGRDGGDATAE